MVTAVVLLNFGEPEDATRAKVVPFLERIFTANASLDGDPTPAQIRARSRDLAERRAPGLIAEYEAIGGSPLNAQAVAQAKALQAVLHERGRASHVLAAFQFTEPTIEDVARTARDLGVQQLVGLPVYPLCGHSTTTTSLRALAGAVEALDWGVEYLEISGWHPHELYLRLRADGVLATAAAAGLDLNAGARLVFSAHGTPVKYLRAGSRYDRYVDECCRRVAQLAGVREYVVGFQNHTNRPVEWTQPDIEEVVAGIDAEDIVVVPISFMHEQSETLAELDRELRERAEARGLGFHRVPVPHADPRFAEVLADLVESRLGEGPLELSRCLCRPTDRTCCLNGSG